MQAADLPITTLRGLLDSRALGCVELAESFITRTAAAVALNAYVSFDADALRRQAQAAETRIAAGERLPLLGIPLALKDNIDALGFACGAGTTALQGIAPPADAALVRRLRAAGALLTGKTSLHELALGITNHNAVTGAVHNPWDVQRMPGGSSGGSAVVVAARLVPAAIGTDTGGSVRIPAALCGVVGLRPSTGRMPGAGIAPICSTRDTAGPLARCVQDLALIDAVLSGERLPPSTSLSTALPTTGLRGLRLGVPRLPFWRDVEPDVQAVCEQALNALRDAGAELVPLALPGVAETSAEAGSAIALFEFVRDMAHYLHSRACGVTLAQLVAAVASPDVAATVQPLLAGGAVPESLYRQALQTRTRLQALYHTAFTQHRIEALLFPSTPRTAARIGEDTTVLLNGREQPTFETFIRNTEPGSVAGLPGVSLPAGLAAGLPVGLALDGPRGSDRRLLAIAAALQTLLPVAAQAPLAGD